MERHEEKKGLAWFTPQAFCGHIHGQNKEAVYRPWYLNSNKVSHQGALQQYYWVWFNSEEANLKSMRVHRLICFLTKQAGQALLLTSRVLQWLPSVLPSIQNILAGFPQCLRDDDATYLFSSHPQYDCTAFLSDVYKKVCCKPCSQRQQLPVTITNNHLGTAAHIMVYLYKIYRAINPVILHVH